MEIKIVCPCGSKYKFEVEPLGGKLPGPVQCPVCGADGTELGNEIITQAMAGTEASAPGTENAVPAIRIPTSSKPAGGHSFVAPSIPRSSKDYAPAAVPAGPTVATAAAAEAHNPAAEESSLVPQPSTGAPRLSVAGGHGSASTTNTQPPPPR